MGFFSKVLGIGKDNGASALLQEATTGLKSLRAPTAEELTYQLDQLVQEGVITPEQAKAYLQEGTAFSEISTDPRLEAAQMAALSSLQDIAKSGGLTATDKARIGEITSRIGQEERGAREAIIQREAERGRAGSGLELAALLENQQGAATRASQEGADVAAMAEQRALEALTQAGALGGQIRSQEFGEQSDVASAKDIMARFNAEHLNATNEANAARRMAAQTQNLAEKQRVSDTNAGIRGQNRQIAADAKQTAYENELDKRKSIAAALSAQAQEKLERAKQRDAFVGNLVGTAGTVGAAAVTKSDERSKNIDGDAPDMDSFMEALKPIAFSYKNPGSKGAAPGANVGVTAQDVEKTPVGKTMVKDTSGGKMLDMQKGFGVILAALAALHDKYEDMERKMDDSAAVA